MAERARERADDDGPVAEAVNPEKDAVYTYAEVTQAGQRFGVSNETIVGALSAAGIPRDAHLTAKQVESAVKDFYEREVQD